MKFLEFVKKHKVVLIVVAIALVLLILMFFGIKNAFFSNASKGKYGNRLDGIENYKIEDSNINDIKTMLTETGIVNKVTYDLEGRIINFIIEVQDEVDLVTSRSLADKIAEKFSDEIKSFYDIQVFLTCVNKESELYPTIGYKHKTSGGFKWNIG